MAEKEPTSKEYGRTIVLPPHLVGPNRVRTADLFPEDVPPSARRYSINNVDGRRRKATQVFGAAPRRPRRR